MQKTNWFYLNGKGGKGEETLISILQVKLDKNKKS